MEYFSYKIWYAGPTNTHPAMIKVRQIGLKKLVSICYDHKHSLYRNYDIAVMKTHRSLEDNDLDILSYKELKKGCLIIGVAR